MALVCEEITPRSHTTSGDKNFNNFPENQLNNLPSKRGRKERRGV